MKTRIKTSLIKINIQEDLSTAWDTSTSYSIKTMQNQEEIAFNSMWHFQSGLA